MDFLQVPRQYRVIGITGAAHTVAWHPTFEAAMDAAARFEAARIFSPDDQELVAFDLRREVAP